MSPGKGEESTMKPNKPAGNPARSALLASAIAAFSVPAYAQTYDENEQEVLDVVTVTGTRIQNQNVIAASPVTTIGGGRKGRRFYLCQSSTDRPS